MENSKSNWTTRDALSHGWNKTKENFWFITALLLLTYIISYATEDSAVGFLVSIFTGFIIASVFLRMSRGTVVTFNNLFADLSPGKLVQYAVMMLVMTVFIVIGFVLLVFPGVIIAIMMSLSAFILMDAPKDISWKSNTFWVSMKKSRALTNGEKWNLLGFFFVVLALNILGALAFGLGLIITMPVTCMALAHIYDALKNKDKTVIPEIVGNTEDVHASETASTDN